MTLVPAPAEPPGVTAAATHAYISDMLSQLADMARGCGDRRLEGAMRLLALEAATQTAEGGGSPGDLRSKVD